jgi:hypothetical protein
MSLKITEPRHRQGIPSPRRDAIPDGFMRDTGRGSQ